MQTITLLSLTATLATVLSAATPPTIKIIEPSEIARLNDCIQIRFLDRKAFGFGRIAPSQFHGMRIFQAENPTEQAVVAQLRQKGLEVAVYLVGRQALTAAVFPTPRTGLQGPASITLLGDSRLPDQASLLAEGKTALAEIGQGPGYETRKGDWTVAIRPLRASNQTCIQCHTYGEFAPKMGDALGVAMYVYRKSR
jgi:hypothetical protein